MAEPAADVPKRQRIAAAVAYLTALPFGPVIPIVILVIFRSAEPKFARFHAIQAAAQYAYLIPAAVLAMLAMLVTGIIGFMRTPADEFAAAPPPVMMIGTVIAAGLVVGVYVLLMLAAPFMAFFAHRGTWIRLPVIGRVLANDLETL